MVTGAPSNSLWDDLCKRSEKVNGELVVFAYGALVSQVSLDYPDPQEASKQLDRIGMNIGHRIIEDFLSKAMSVGAFGLNGTYPKGDLKCICEYLKQAFRYYLSSSVVISIPSEPIDQEQKEEAILTLDHNPFQQHVELPIHLKDGLIYSAVLCGIIRGSLEMLQISAELVQLDSLNFKLSIKQNEGK